jgi:hypothetical protein
MANKTATKAIEIDEAARKEWLNTHAFTAYRMRNSETKKLVRNFVLVDEDRPVRGAIIRPTLDECIDAAIRGEL